MNFSEIGVFPALLLSSATLVAIWMVLIVLQQTRTARLIEVLSVLSAALAASRYFLIWGLTWPR